MASVEEHYRLIELAMAGEASAIKQLLKQHIRTWEPIFVDAVQKNARQALPSRAGGGRNETP